MSEYSAHDASQPRRLLVFPPSYDGDSTVVPDEPTDGTWAMAAAYPDSIHAITLDLESGDEVSEEYVILTYRPYHDGYPPGRYVVADDLAVDEGRHDDGTPARVEVTVTIDGDEPS